MMQPTTEHHETRIEIRGLVKRYNAQSVLNDLSLTVDDGDLCLLVGANGAGKTTLLRILTTLARPDAGIITLGGVPLGTNPSLRQKIGYIGHPSLFYSDLNAIENLGHYARLYHLPEPDAKVRESIHSVGLEQHQHKPLRTYSRGMQQRLAIARALLHDPAILLLDEPYTGLDQEAAHWLDERLRTLHTPGRAILLAAHRPQRLLTIASHVAWLKEGQISLHIPVRHLAETPELNQYLQEAT